MRKFSYALRTHPTIVALPQPDASSQTPARDKTTVFQPTLPINPTHLIPKTPRIPPVHTPRPTHRLRTGHSRWLSTTGKTDVNRRLVSTTYLHYGYNGIDATCARGRSRRRGSDRNRCESAVRGPVGTLRYGSAWVGSHASADVHSRSRPPESTWNARREGNASLHNCAAAARPAAVASASCDS